MSASSLRVLDSPPLTIQVIASLLGLAQIISNNMLVLFTEEMSTEEVNFLGKMMLDEIMELFATVLPAKEAKDALKLFIDERWRKIPVLMFLCA